LDAKTALGIGPLNGTINAGDHTGAAFQTASKFNHHLSLVVERIEVRRTSINAKPFFAAFTDLLVEANMRFFVILKSIERQLICNPHESHPSYDWLVPHEGLYLPELQPVLKRLIVKKFFL
jgi:hypothetical protein